MITTLRVPSCWLLSETGARDRPSYEHRQNFELWLPTQLLEDTLNFIYFLPNPKEEISKLGFSEPVLYVSVYAGGSEKNQLPGIAFPRLHGIPVRRGCLE